MPKYTKIKQQIVGIEAVAESVKASEDVAASRLHLLRNVTGNLRDYVDDLRRMLEAFAVHHELATNRFFHAGSGGSRLLLAIGFDRGLTGGLDNRLTEATVAVASEYDRVVAVGQRLVRKLTEEGIGLAKELPAPSDQVTDEECSAISQFAIDAYVSGQASQVDVLIPEFESLAVQTPGRLPFLPLQSNHLTDVGDVSTLGRAVGRDQAATPVRGVGRDQTAGTGRRAAMPGGDGWPLFLPSPREVADGLIQTYLRMFFKSRLTEAKLSELAARTVACEHAATQAQDQADAMTNRYFKERRRELSRRQIESFFAHQVAQEQPSGVASA